MVRIIRKNLLNIKKLVLTFILVYSTNYSIVGQNVITLGSGFNYFVNTLTYDTLNNILYAGGSFNQLGLGGTSMNYISRWDGLSWNPMGLGANGYIFSSVMFNGNLIVGGSFTELDGIPCNGLGYWDGFSWNCLANTSRGLNNASVVGLYVDGTNLYVGGTFDTLNGQFAQGIAMYDGNQWYSYPPLVNPIQNFFVSAITIYNSQLYIGGNFNAGVGKSDIVKYDGQNWVSVGGGFSGAWTSVTSFEIFQNELVIAGKFSPVYGDPGENIITWDGINWGVLGGGLSGSLINCVSAFDNKLLAGGIIFSSNGTPIDYFGIWDGLNWTNYNNLIFDNSVVSIARANNRLFVGGNFYSIGSDTVRFVAELTQQTFDEFIEQESFGFYPNPTSDDLTIEGEGITQVSIIDVSGRLVLRKEVFEPPHRLDVSGLAKGMYVVEVETEEGNGYTKFLKE